MPIQGPQWSEFLSCPVCYNRFDSDGREPITLGCSHSICLSCLSRLSKQNCPFDQTEITKDIDNLPYNYALLQLVGKKPPETLNVNIKEVEENHSYFEGARKCIESLGQYLAPLVTNNNNTVTSTVNSTSATCSGVLTRPMQRKLVTLVNCQLAEEEGRCRALRAARSLGERAVKELILLHQNAQQLSGNLWSAVRLRGCQFLGPAMQEEVLRYILLALEEGNSLCRKVLVLYVVQKLEFRFAQASKTSIGHVVQLLYRASCFKVTKREGDSSLLQLQERYRTYSALRKEHDAQIVQIAMEAGLHISPEQWSALLYGDDIHKSHMQSIIDKLQSPASFSASIQELIIALQRTGDPANLQKLKPHLELLAAIDPNPERPSPSWNKLHGSMEALKEIVLGLVEFMQNNSANVKGTMEPQHPVNSKYKTHMCRDILKKGSCPRGASCTFAHSSEELQRFGRRKKPQVPKIRGNLIPDRNGSSSSPETVDSCDKGSGNGHDTSNSDRECSDTLPEDGANGTTHITRDSQPSILLQDVQNVQSITQTMCSPAQYPTTVNGSYGPNYTFSPTVDRNSGMPSPVAYMPDVTLHRPTLGNGALGNGYYSPAQPPSVNGISGSFSRPPQIPSPGLPQSLPCNREVYLNEQPDVSFYGHDRQRSDSFPPPVVTSPLIPPQYCGERYPVLPLYQNRIPYNPGMHVYSAPGLPDGFHNYSNSYYPLGNTAKSGRPLDSPGPSVKNGKSNDGQLTSRVCNDDIMSKRAWNRTEVSTPPKSEYVSKFCKMQGLSSCDDTSYSSYLSDTFTPKSSGSPPFGRLWEFYAPSESQEKENGEAAWRSRESRFASCTSSWNNSGSLKNVWEQPEVSSRLQQSYDDQINISCESTLDEVDNDSESSYQQNLFGLGPCKNQDTKNNNSGGSYWYSSEQFKTTPLDKDLDFLQRNNSNPSKKLLSPPPGIKTVGCIGDRREPVNSSESSQGGNEEALSDSWSGWGSLLRGTRHQIAWEPQRSIGRE